MSTPKTYRVTGRIPGDEEDSSCEFLARGAKDAERMFGQWLFDIHGCKLPRGYKNQYPNPSDWIKHLQERGDDEAEDKVPGGSVGWDAWFYVTYTELVDGNPLFRYLSPGDEKIAESASKLLESCGCHLGESPGDAFTVLREQKRWTLVERDVVFHDRLGGDLVWASLWSFAGGHYLLWTDHYGGYTIPRLTPVSDSSSRQLQPVIHT